MVYSESFYTTVHCNQKIIQNGTGGPVAAVGVHTNTEEVIYFLFGQILLLIENNYGTTSS